MDLTSLNKDRKKRKPSVDLSTMVYGKLPPQAKEIEEAVLGAILMQGSAYEVCSEILQPENFYVEAHQLIYAVIESLHNRHIPVDILTVVEELKSREQLDAVGGPYYVTKLTSNVVSSAHIEAHAQIVRKTFEKRALIKLGGYMVSEAYEDSTSSNEIIDHVGKELDEVTKNTSKVLSVDMANNTLVFVQELDNRRVKATKGETQGITSGFPEIDQLTNGWQQSDLITLAAMSSAGKTAMALNFAINAAIKGHPSAFFTREMTKIQLTERCVSILSSVPLEAIKSGKIDDDTYKHMMKKGISVLEKLPLYIIPASGLNWMEVRRSLMQLKRKYGVVFSVDDYVQIAKDIETKGKNREQIIATISGENKETAQSLNIAFMQLSQVLGKEIVKRDNKEPQMQDVRESEAIVNDSNLLMMLYRPEYHGLFSGEQGENLAGKAYLKFAKFRDGRRNEKVELRSNLSIQKFYSPLDFNGGEIFQTKQSIIFDPSKAHQQFDEGIKAEDEFSFIK